jgi:uncharacterized protein YbjT (DUF2867 family)
MIVLVTGATGTVGRHLVSQLIHAGHDVRALTRNPEKAELPTAARVVRGDLIDVATLRPALDGAEAVHLITFGSSYEPLTNGAEIVHAAQEAGVRRVTVLKGDVAPSPLEEAIMASGLTWTFLGPVEFMANMLDWAPGIREDGVVRAPFVDQGGPSVHEADIAAVAAVALTEDGHGGQTYWITGPEVLTARDKVRIIGEVLGRDVQLVEQTEEELVAQYREQGWSGEDIAWFLDMAHDPPAVGRVVQPTVERVTGRPGRSFAQWVREHAAAFGS